MPTANTETRFFRAPFTYLQLDIQGNALRNLEFLPPDAEPENLPSQAETPIEQALQTYFATGQLPAVPLLLQGTPFQQRVWQVLQSIPSGKTMTYGQIAKQLQTSARAVGNACRQNPLALFVPCHRVVAAHHIGGFMGKHPQWAAYKKWLLAFEAEQAA